MTYEELPVRADQRHQSHGHIEDRRREGGKAVERLLRRAVQQSGILQGLQTCGILERMDMHQSRPDSIGKSVEGSIAVAGSATKGRTEMDTQSRRGTDRASILYNRPETEFDARREIRALSGGLLEERRCRTAQPH